MSQTDHSCCGVIDEVRARRTRSKPHPWIVRKLAVGLCVLIVGYSTYVYAARFCKNMITQSSGALASQATGVAFLVVFSILLFLMSWCYVMVITTSPGNARLYTQTTTKPGYDHHDIPSTLDYSDIRGTSYELTSHTPLPLTHEPAQSSLGSGNGTTVASQLSAATSSSVAKMEQRSHSQPSSRGFEEAQVTTKGSGAPDSPHLPDSATLPTHANSASPRPPPMFSRRPTTTPVLLPEYRYCSKCRIIKPSRAHHCRACGTCILKYDHHCPWIGQCVGAFNQKFFVNFLQWGMLFYFWTFSTLLGLNVKRRPSAASELDPQQIVVIALAGLFGIFCTLVLLSQLHLMLLNQTTVESLNFRSMRDREQELLSQNHKWHQFWAKRETQRQWDNEWGRIGVEGNLWWLGSFRANWVAVMGENVWWWILPVGRHLGDGLNYSTNPRFDSAGRWRKRKEWPSELQ